MGATDDVLDWAVRLRDQVEATGVKAMAVWMSDGTQIIWRSHGEGALYAAGAGETTITEDMLDERRWAVVES